MSKKEVRQVFQSLSEDLTADEFLEKAGLRRETIQAALSREYWEAVISGLIPVKKRFTCRQIFDICRPMMTLLSPEPEGGWMPFAYRFVCHILYPEEEFTAESAPYRAGAVFYLEILRFFFDIERRHVPFEPMKDFQFLSPEEMQGFECAAEYQKFLRFWRSEYIYEMMRLNAEVTAFNTLEHIAGVHYVAMTVARGLYRAGLPIDLTLISGAAAGHDLGKFGCKPNERVPYMHYYYTDVWYTTRGIRTIGHIAANHSTWDLEPSNLSVESLTLIYSDFRVKVSRDRNGVERTRISSLSEAFDVILHKLQNVDEKKFHRYEHVYSKLADFERYMRFRGVDADLDGKPKLPEPMPEPVLRNPAQSIESLVFMAIEHNIDVMHQMNAELQFGNLLEAARSEKHWKNVRAYLNIFSEYFTYTNDTQKEQMLSFLYELFMGRDGEIRTQAAFLMGRVIAQFNAGYRKSLPTGRKDLAQEKVLSLWRHYIGIVLDPDHRLIDLQQTRIRAQMRSIFASLVENADERDLPAFLGEFLRWYRKADQYEDGEKFALLNPVELMPFDRMSAAQIREVAEFSADCAGPGNQKVRIMAWRNLSIIADYLKNSGRMPAEDVAAAEAADFCAVRGRILNTVESVDTSSAPAFLFLKFRIYDALGVDTEKLQKLLYGRDLVTEIFLDNLKVGTPWVAEVVNIMLLADHELHGDKNHILHIAAHFSNMIKVGQYMLVRSTAGEQLIRIAKVLSPDQRNEIAVEMLRSLETEDTDYSRSIPRWLGRFALWLPPEQLDEIIASLKGLLASPSDNVCEVMLDTVGTLLEHYGEYPERFPEPEDTYSQRKKRLFGLLLTGMASYRERVHQEALLVLGQSVFGSRYMTQSEKYEIFCQSYRKILFELTENVGGEMTKLYRASALAFLYRFITDYRLSKGEFQIEERHKVAFFPGTFDPFTLSHREIARKIRDLDFDVYLSVDEFSWSKKTQPHLIRRSIVNMSIADEFHINLFPYQIPLNPGRPEDLRRLRQIFKGRELYLVEGSDVVANASYYQDQSPVSAEIRSMNHIVFRRVGDARTDSRLNRGMMEKITGKLLELELPKELEEISSTRIRENIDMNRDISNLIDPVVQEYIYNNSLYLREPEYKPIIEARAVTFEMKVRPDASLVREITGLLDEKQDPDRVAASIRNSGDGLLLLRNNSEDNRLIGAARVRVLLPDELFPILKTVSLTDLVRQRTAGNVLLISGIYAKQDAMIHDGEQLLLTEALIRSYAKRCDNAIFYPEDGYCTERVLSAVLRSGFLKPEGAENEVPLYFVDMHNPLVLLANMETTLKEPFSSMDRVLRTVHRAQKDLQRSMADLYPGQLVLSVSSSVLFHRLVDKITTLNGVPRDPVTPRQLGSLMCVPFGKILRGRVVPNTVTKTIHTDKVYAPDLKSASVEAFPGYTPLPVQMRAIKSFDRPVILVDDVMNRSGIRINTLAPMLAEEGVQVRKLLLGVISGYARDTLRTLHIPEDCIYYIPNMRYWFAESSLYPFIGGDTVRREKRDAAGTVPSINLIYPYTNPPLDGASSEALFNFSACCIKNARDVLLVLEQEYRSLFSRNLTLSRLSEAVILPLCPDKGSCIQYDPNLAASVYLQNDLEMLYRSRVNTRTTKERRTGR